MFCLPSVHKTPLAAVICEWLPDATFFHAFSTDAIEIYFDHRNLSRTHLVLDDLSREPYGQAPSFERQSQWHFPRRWHGGPEALSNSDQIVAAG